MFRHARFGTLVCSACLLGSIVVPMRAPRAQDASISSLALSPAQMSAAGIRLASAQALTAEQMANAAGSGTRLTGQVVTPGDRSEVILSTVAGQVESVLVLIGTSVKAGQPLARLYSAELAALQREYLHARAEAAVAASRAARDEALFEDGIIAESRLREARASQEIASATRQERRRLLLLAGFTDSAIDTMTADSLSSSVTLHAKRAGTVLEQPLSAGQRVEAGATLFRIAAPGRWWLELNASAAQGADLHLGDKVSVAGCDVPGKIIAVGTLVQASTQTIPVRADMPDTSSCLRLNQFIEADVGPASLPQGLVSVAASAVVRNGARSYVFVHANDRFTPTPVSVHRRQGSDVWLSGGLADGASIASAGTAALKGAWLGLGVPVAAPAQK